MNRIELLLHGWDATYDQEDWYPPLAPALEGLTAQQASWRPPGEAANTIWELVSHLLYYKERMLHRIKGEDFPSLPDNDATFTVSVAEGDESAWRAVVTRMETVHRQIREALSRMDDDTFDRPTPKIPLGIAVTSLILHDAYHTGQIIQIRKLQGSWPSHRSFL